MYTDPRVSTKLCTTFETTRRCLDACDSEQVVLFDRLAGRGENDVALLSEHVSELILVYGRPAGFDPRVML